MTNYGLTKYFWTYDAISVDNLCIQGFNENDLQIRVPYMSGFGRLYQVNMKGSTEQDSVYIHNMKRFDKLLIGLPVFWGMRFVEKCLCLDGGGDTKWSLLLD